MPYGWEWPKCNDILMMRPREVCWNSCSCCPKMLLDRHCWELGPSVVFFLILSLSYWLSCVRTLICFFDTYGDGYVVYLQFIICRKRRKITCMLYFPSLILQCFPCNLYLLGSDLQLDSSAGRWASFYRNHCHNHLYAYLVLLKCEKFSKFISQLSYYRSQCLILVLYQFYILQTVYLAQRPQSFLWQWELFRILVKIV